MPGQDRPPKAQNRHGGKREGAGRPPGPTAFKHIRELARSRTADSVLTLANIMDSSNNPRLRLAAAKAILDLAYGKPRKGAVVDQEDS